MKMQVTGVVPKGEASAPEMSYLVPEGMPVQLVDSIAMRNVGGMVELMLFKAEHPGPVEQGGEKSGPVPAYCQARFAITMATFRVFANVFETHGELVQKDLEAVLKSLKQLSEAEDV